MSLSPIYFSYFVAVGFPIQNQIEFERLLKLTLERGRSVPTLTGKYVVWRPGEGVEIWVKVRDRKVRGCTPHFAGSGSLPAIVSGLQERTGELVDGSLHGRGIAETDDDDATGYPLIVDLPDFEIVGARLAPPLRATLQVSALAHELNCFEDPSEFRAWAKSAGGVVVRSAGQEVAAIEMLPEAVESTAPNSSGNPQAAIARLTGRVLSATMRANPATHQSFIALSVSTPDGGALDVAAAPQTASGDLVTGGVIHGTVRLTARVLVPPAPYEGAEAPAKETAAPPPMLSRLTQWVRGGSSSS